MKTNRGRKSEPLQETGQPRAKSRPRREHLALGPHPVEQVAKDGGVPPAIATEFARTVEERPGGPQEPVFVETEITVPIEPGAKQWKFPRGGTPEELFRWRRHNLGRLLNAKLNALDQKFDLLVQLANREQYEITQEEFEALTAHLSVAVALVEKSFQLGKPQRPLNLPPVELAETIFVDVPSGGRRRRPRNPRANIVW